MKDGVQHCDGIQALTYARLRSLKGQKDFNRTDRQRNLLDLLMKKVMQNMNFNQLLSLIKVCTEYAYTNITPDTFLSLAKTILSSGLLSKVGSEDSLFTDMHIPQPGKYQYGTANGASVLTLNIPDHTKLLHEFVYGQYYPANP